MQILTHFSASTVSLEKYPFKSEAAMEGYIIDNPSVLSLSNGDDVEIYDSQVSWEGNKDSQNGRLDVLAIYNKNTNAIVELKHGTLKKADYDQLERYFEGDSYLKNADKLGLKSDNWVGVLVGSDIDEEFEDKVSTLRIQGKLPLYVILLKRYRDKNKDQFFVLSNLIYGKAIKYSLEGEEYKYCNRLVLALIQKYVDKNPNVSRADVAAVFEKYGFYDGDKVAVIKEYDEKENYEKSGNYFSKTDERVNIKGISCLVKSFWYKEDMDKIIKLAKEDMGITITPL